METVLLLWKDEITLSGFFYDFIDSTEFLVLNDWADNNISIQDMKSDVYLNEGPFDHGIKHVMVSFNYPYLGIIFHENEFYHTHIYNLENNSLINLTKHDHVYMQSTRPPLIQIKDKIVYHIHQDWDKLLLTIYDLTKNKIMLNNEIDKLDSIILKCNPSSYCACCPELLRFSHMIVNENEIILSHFNIRVQIDIQSGEVIDVVSHNFLNPDVITKQYKKQIAKAYVYDNLKIHYIGNNILFEVPRDIDLGQYPYFVYRIREVVTNMQWIPLSNNSVIPYITDTEEINRYSQTLQKLLNQ